MTRSAYISGRVTKNKQDGSREFISLLACVSAIGKAIPPLLIYKGSSGDLQDTWVTDVKADDGVYFASSDNGWSSNKLGLTWLKTVFEPNTRPKSSRTRRLLLVDGHSSHVNMEFIDFADRHRIIIMILPPHTTHRLQPLDVVLFQVLSTAYSQELDNLMNSSGGLVSMSKRFFYRMFKAAWEKSFTEKNIQRAFDKPGIWPVAGDKMIQKVTKPEVEVEPEPELEPELGLLKLGPKTPLTSKAIRRAHREFERSPSKLKFSKIITATRTLSAQVDILRHENRGLRTTMILEKQKRKKGKKLNLTGEQSSGVEVYSPGKVITAR